MSSDTKRSPAPLRQVKSVRARGNGTTGTHRPIPYSQVLGKLGHVQHGWLRLYSQDPELALESMLGDKEPLISNGFGGWTTQPRPRRVEMTLWPGRKTFQLVVELLFDCWTSEDPTDDVEGEISVLEAMAQVAQGKNEPPILQLDGAGSVPHDVHSSPDAFWVLNDIVYSGQLWNDNGRRARAIATCTFLEYEPDEFAPNSTTKTQSSAKKRNQQKKKPAGAARKTYIVKQGDTLTSIAAHMLGAASRWHEIAKLNGLRDPKAVHVGQRLNLP